MVDGVLRPDARLAPEPYAAGTDGPEAAARLDPDGSGPHGAGAGERRRTDEGPNASAVR